jgi:hypothetical protein
MGAELTSRPESSADEHMEARYGLSAGDLAALRLHRSCARDDRDRVVEQTKPPNANRAMSRLNIERWPDGSRTGSKRGRAG